MPPPSVVRYDGDDPYLVVAADKGTATFSDIANAIAGGREAPAATAATGQPTEMRLSAMPQQHDAMYKRRLFEFRTQFHYVEGNAFWYRELVLGQLRIPGRQRPSHGCR